MGLFETFKMEKTTSNKKIFGMNIEDIWQLEDKTLFLIAMSDWLNRKCGYGEHISLLTLEERVIFIVDLFQAEVNNGGFDQYLHNRSGIFAGELVSSLLAIGACLTAEICKRALSTFPAELPADYEARYALLDELITDEIAEALDSFDMQIYDYPDDLENLMYLYITENKSSFK